MSLNHPIAQGRTADIYPWGDRMILKLFHTWVSEDSVRHEARVSRAVHDAGLAVPGVGEITEVEGRLGLEYERLEGRTMGEVMAAKPWLLLRLARQLAELHVTLHELEGFEGLPSQRERLVHKIQSAKGLPAVLQNKALHALTHLPEGERLCHGDFHPWNVFMAGDRAVVIDWGDATYGNPLADVARTAIIIEGVKHMTTMVTWAERLLVGWYLKAYVKHYFDLRPEGIAEYHAWRPVVAAARMNEDIPGLEHWLREQVEKGE